MKKPTTEDAHLMLELFRTFSDPRMEEAMKWFEKDFSAKDWNEFKSKYPVGSDGMNHVGRILGTLEVAGVLVSHGLLNENLYFDSSGVEFMWEKLGKIVPGWQKEMSAALWENAAWLAERQKKWKKQVWKPGLKWKMPPE